MSQKHCVNCLWYHKSQLALPFDSCRSFMQGLAFTWFLFLQWLFFFSVIPTFFSDWYIFAILVVDIYNVLSLLFEKHWLLHIRFNDFLTNLYDLKMTRLQASALLKQKYMPFFTKKIKLYLIYKPLSVVMWIYLELWYLI